MRNKNSKFHGSVEVPVRMNLQDYKDRASGFLPLMQYPYLLLCISISGITLIYQVYVMYMYFVHSV